MVHTFLQFAPNVKRTIDSSTQKKSTNGFGGFPLFSITHLHNAGHCSVERMVPAIPRRCFQKTDLDTFSFGVSDFLRE
jgi:hypothetical protein